MSYAIFWCISDPPHIEEVSCPQFYIARNTAMGSGFAVLEGKFRDMQTFLVVCRPEDTFAGETANAYLHRAMFDDEVIQ